jgi:NADH:ubiquinone oxidoreductase subunit D
MIQETIEIGPIHEWLPGPMKLRLGMSGDRIEKVEAAFGYAAREIEKTVIGLPLQRAQFFVSRVEPETALILDRLFSEAVEKITGTAVSERILWIRSIVTAISEINFQLKYLANISKRLGVNILFHTILKHRESLLDLLELLSGSRYGYYYIVPGGARYDITEGFQERLEAWCGNFLQDFQRIEALFRWTHVFQNRLRSLGMVMDPGDSGFVSEASIETTRYGDVSHVESRLVYSLESCRELCVEVRETLLRRPAGAFLRPLGEGSGETRHELETLRGVWALDLAVRPEGTVGSIRLGSPSSVIVNSIGPALVGESLEDLPLILESLSFSIPEIDR